MLNARRQIPSTQFDTHGEQAMCVTATDRLWHFTIISSLRVEFHSKIEELIQKQSRAQREQSETKLPLFHLM